MCLIRRVRAVDHLSRRVELLTIYMLNLKSPVRRVTYTFSNNCKLETSRHFMQLLYQDTGLLGREKDVQRCLESLAQVSALIDRICSSTVQLPCPSRDEYESVDGLFNSHLSTANVPETYTRKAPAAHIQLESDIESACRRLETLMSQLSCADEAIWQEEDVERMQLPTRTSILEVGSQPRTNIFNTLSAASGSQQVLVSTTGNPIHARNVTSAPHAKQILGQMSDVSLKAFLE
jgi:hypothetical protein